MGRIESYEDYMSSAFAYFKYSFENFQNNSSKNKEIILEENYIKGAKVAFLANIMTGIKEDIVSKEKGYSSKVMLERLEDTVDFIAVKTSNGYEVDGCHFDSAAEVVAIIRNKLAHGKYSLDLKNDLIIFDIENKDVEVSITKLSCFIVNAIRNYLKDQKGSQITRHISYINTENINNTIKTESQIRGLLGRCHTKSFTLKSKDGSDISQIAKSIFEQMISMYKYKGEDALRLKEFKDAQKFLLNNGYEIEIKSKSIGENRLKKLVPSIKKNIFDNDLIDKEQKITLMLKVIEKNNRSYDKKFSNMMSNFNNLLLIDAIENTNSVDNEKIDEYFFKHYGNEMVLSFEELVSSIIAMFNPLFQYLFDEVYTKPGEYTANREGYFDFSKLDMSLLDDKNMFYTISDKPYLDELLNQLGTLSKTIDKLYEKLKGQNDNLNNIDVKKPNSSMIIKTIKESIAKTTSNYQSSIQNKIMLENHIDYVENDLNSDYYKNRAIIEGIRNCISHGNYELKINEGDLWSSKIIFKDIYEGKETFSLEVSVENFMNFILNNVKEPTLFVQEKINNKNKTY